MNIRVTDLSLNHVSSDLLVLPLFEDERPLRGLAARVDWIHCGALSRLIASGIVRGARGEALLFLTSRIPTPRVLLIGLGSRAEGLFSWGPFFDDLRGRMEEMQLARAAVELFSEDGSVADFLSRQGNSNPLDLFLLCPGADRVKRFAALLAARSPAPRPRLRSLTDLS